MNTNDTVSAVAQRLDDQDPDELPEPASSALRRIQPYISDSARSGNLAVVTGVVSLVRAVRTFRKGDRKRAMLRALGGLVWIGIALSQRRRSGGKGGGGTGEVEQSDVADTGPDLDDLETTQEYGGEPATGEEVVDTTPADIDESDTAPELDSDVDAEEFDQSDVVGNDEIEGMEGSEEVEGDERTAEGDESSDTEMGAEGVDAERDDSAMEFGDPEMEIGEVERESGDPDMEAGEMGTHVGEDEDESESAE